MAESNVEFQAEAEPWDVDDNEISLSAFHSVDEFKPKIHTKDLGFGKRRSFLCYNNPAFDNSFYVAEDPIDEEGQFSTINFDGDVQDGDDWCEDPITRELPSSQEKRHFKTSSLRHRKMERRFRNIPEVYDDFDLDNGQKQEAQRLSRWKQFKFSVAMSWDGFKSDTCDFFKDIDFWKSNLKTVEGKFGSGVLSYFKFLRWLYLLDMVISIFVLAFIVTPQLMYSPSYKRNNASFTGMEFLTGKGWFLNTEIYYSTYGGYKNDTVSLSHGTPYNLTLAYLLVAGGYILLCLVTLVRSMAISYKENYISGQDFRTSFFTKVFCSWDYALTQENSAYLQCRNIQIDLLETLTESRTRRRRDFSELSFLTCVRLVNHIIVIALMGGACFGLYWVKTEGVDKLRGVIKLNQWTDVFFNLLPAMTITALNAILPFVFRFIASRERYDSPRVTIEISLFRTVLLKLSTLCVYIWLIYSDIEKAAAFSGTGGLSVNATLVSTKPFTNPSSCWERAVGVQFYQLAIVDFIFVILETLFGEMMRRSFASFMNACGCNFDYPGFDISRNVLGLIYSQGLCWLGAFFCPMLPLITVIKFYILFHYKKFSVLSFCRPSMRPFKASKMQLRFLFLLGFMLTFAIVVIGLVIINETRLKPSLHCGPFRGRKSIFATVEVVLNRDFSKEIRDITNSVASTVVLATVFFIIGMVTYFERLRKLSAEKKIKLLKREIAKAGQTKIHLRKRIRCLQEEMAKPYLK